jgi:hypothetical protein
MTTYMGQATEAQWEQALRAELEIVKSLASRSCPSGVNEKTWDAITLPYKMEIPVLETMFGQSA